MELNQLQDFPVINANDGGIGAINGQQNGQVAGTSTSNSNTPQMSVILTIRLLMQSKEVGSIIGKKGDHVKQIREKSGAKVNISDGSCPERIVTITGNVTTINKAFSMICKKSEEDLQALPNSVPQPPITMRLIVPATQCGSLIGKRGSKIKEIRESTGASIQVATEMLPSSTERAVTISGTCTAIIDCMQEICHILLEAPPKGTNLPFRPKPNYNPLLIASSAAAAAAAQQQATQHLTAVMMQQNQKNQQHAQAQAQAQQQFQQAQQAAVAQSAASMVGYNASMFAANPELARLHFAVPRFNFPAGALFANSSLGNGLMNLPNVVVSSASGNTVVDPTAAAAALFQKDPAAAALFWSQQQQHHQAIQQHQQQQQQQAAANQNGVDEKQHQQNAAVAHAAAAAAAAAAAQNQTNNDQQTLDYISNFAQPYLLNNGVLVGRTMGVGGTPLKPDHATTSSSAAAVLQSSAAGRRFSPY